MSIFKKTPKIDPIAAERAQFDRDCQIICKILGSDVFKSTCDPDLRKRAIQRFKDSQEGSWQSALRILQMDPVANFEKAKIINSMLTS